MTDIPTAPAADAAIGGASIDDLPWIDYVDEHDRVHGGQVKLVNPRTMYVRFPPGFRAPEHWHPFDTTYFVTAGSIMFGDEGWFERGGVRWVSAGHVYGPELAGDDGVEFLLVSSGPIELNYPDITPPPASSGAG